MLYRYRVSGINIVKILDIDKRVCHITMWIVRNSFDHIARNAKSGSSRLVLDKSIRKASCESAKPVIPDLCVSRDTGVIVQRQRHLLEWIPAICEGGYSEINAEEAWSALVEHPPADRSHASCFRERGYLLMVNLRCVERADGHLHCKVN